MLRKSKVIAMLMSLVITEFLNDTRMGFVNNVVWLLLSTAWGWLVELKDHGKSQGVEGNRSGYELNDHRDSRLVSAEPHEYSRCD